MPAHSSNNANDASIAQTENSEHILVVPGDEMPESSAKPASSFSDAMVNSFADLSNPSFKENFYCDSPHGDNSSRTKLSLSDASSVSSASDATGTMNLLSDHLRNDEISSADLTEGGSISDAHASDGSSISSCNDTAITSSNAGEITPAIAGKCQCPFCKRIAENMKRK